MAAPNPGSMGKSRNPTPGPEHALLAHVERLDRHREGRIAVHVHLSRLQAQNRRDHHIRIAQSTFEEKVQALQGHLFFLRNGDIVYIAHANALNQLDEAVLKLRYLFSEDPLTQYSDERDHTGFCAWYRLDRDYPRFLGAVRHLHEMSELARADDGHQALSGPAPVREDTRQPLVPAQLGRLEDLLSKADLSNVMRNQPVCAIVAGAPIQPVFHEIYVSIPDLEQQAVPGVALASNRWLFQYLTQTLDRRVLAHLTRDVSGMERAFSLNLNVASVLSPDFQKFDHALSSGLRGRLVIELQIHDVFADFGAFHFARDYVRDRGYRLCIDGVTHLTLPFVNREKLGVDLVKLLWSPDLAEAAEGRLGLAAELKELVSAAGQARMILCRCDNAQAVDFGRLLGIHMFQGRQIDRALASQRGADLPRR